MKYILHIVLGCLFVTIIGCDSAYYSQSYSFDGSIWNYDDPKTFQFEIEDTLHVYDMILTVDHTDIYPYQNLYLNARTTFPSDTTIEQSLSLEIANAAGIWFGECSGSQCRLSIPIQSKVHFSEIGLYQLNLEQFTRTDTLVGIDKLKMEVLEVARK